MVSISVIIPAMNEEKYIERTIKSLINQSFKDYELIVVDGNSKDKTREIAKKYTKKVIIQKGKGISSARNQGAKIAKGNVLVFIDADTELSKNFLEVINEKMKDKNIAGGSTFFYPEKNSGVFKKALYFFVSCINYIMTYTGNVRTTGYNSFFRKTYFDKVGGYDVSFSLFEDHEISRRIKKYGKIVFLRKVNAYTSSRRFDKNPLKLIYTYLKVEINALLGRDIKKLHY